MKLDLETYVARLGTVFPRVAEAGEPWDMTGRMEALIAAEIARLADTGYRVEGGLCAHRSAVIEPGAVVKPPALIMEGAFVAAHAYLRGGVAIGPRARIGPGCEVKASVVMTQATLAHFVFVGDSIIGSDVNFEAGAVVANRWNERADKTIVVCDRGRVLATGVTRFGAVVGDGSRIGANAVLSPGTLLPPGSVVGRLQLVPPPDG